MNCRVEATAQSRVKSEHVPGGQENSQDKKRPVIRSTIESATSRIQVRSPISDIYTTCIYNYVTYLNTRRANLITFTERSERYCSLSSSVSPEKF